MIQPLKISRTAERVKFTPYGGGLIASRSPRTIKPNRILQCLNFEEVYGSDGYTAIQGYERFDGQSAPSDAVYYVLSFATGTAAISAGDAITGSGASATVVQVNLTSGSWAGGDAAGTLIVMLVTGDWVAGGAIQVAAVTRALATDVLERGSIAQAADQEYMTATRDALRALIQKVPGSGSVLGVAVYREAIYAVRNTTDGASATWWKSSAASWTSVQTGLIPGGAWKFVVANFSGASTTLALFGVDGKNRLSKWDGTTFSRAAPIYGSEAVSTASVTIALGAKTIAFLPTARDWQVGDQLTWWSQADASQSMTGTVTAYAGGTSVDILITSITGAGTYALWEVGRTDLRDKPYLLCEHKDHMALAYPLGQLQLSNLGDPMTYTTTAALFGFGAELTGLLSLKGSVLAVFCRSKIEMISGSTSVDWEKSKHATSVGAIMGTAVDNTGNGLFLHDSGVSSLQAVQAFGNFASADLTRDFKSFITSRIASVVGARIVPGSNQYRLYFDDGNVIRLTMGGVDGVTADDTSITRQLYEVAPVCFGDGVLSDGSTALFFGTADGYVMQEDKGTSFDGAEIDYVLMTAFNHYGLPDNNKRFTELEFDIDSPDAIDINFRQLFDYDDGNFVHGTDIVASTLGTGGLFDVAAFDTFRFDLPIHSKAPVSCGGIGRSMALLIVVTSDFARPFSLRGSNAKFSVTGGQRP